MIPEFPFFECVGELYAVTLCKVLAITRMKVFLIFTGSDYYWGVVLKAKQPRRNL
jgi:hypothetical protein